MINLEKDLEERQALLPKVMNDSRLSNELTRVMQDYREQAYETLLI